MLMLQIATMKCAGVIDPQQVVERTQKSPARRSGRACRRQQVAGALAYASALRACGARDYFTAAECIEKLDRNFATLWLELMLHCWDNVALLHHGTYACWNWVSASPRCRTPWLLGLLHRQISWRTRSGRCCTRTSHLPRVMQNHYYATVTPLRVRSSSHLESPNVRSCQPSSMT